MATGTFVHRSTLAVKREFLGWEKPGLVSAVDYLVKRFGQSEAFDLRHVVIVVPGSRAGRRLLELLIDQAERSGRVFFPPNIITQGRLPELLYRPKRPFADELVQQLAWVEALRTAQTAHVQAVFPTLPAAEDLMAWLALGQVLSRLHRELAADALDFAAVADRGAGLSGFREANRWRALAEIQTAYLRLLDGLELWDMQTARLVAIRQAECNTQSEILLLAVADMNRAEQLMLDQVRDRVTPLVVAPESVSDRFDEYGCLRSEAWKDVPLDLDPRKIEVVEGPADEAAAAVWALASWGGRFSGEEITIGVPDAEIVPYLEQYLRQADVPVRYGVGLPVPQTAPCRLLAAVAEYLDGRRFSTFAALVRHPAVERWLVGQGDCEGWLAELDEYHENHLPYSVDDGWIGPKDSYHGLKAAYRAIEQLLRPFVDRRPLGEWAVDVLGVLTSIFGTKPLDSATEPDRTILAACESIRDVLEAKGRIPQSLGPPMTAPEAMRLILRDLESETVPAMPVRGAVELLGWLELPLDDAPALVVTGFNEGRVPQSLNADAFLPNRLRLALGIEDNDRRYARDAYALAVLAASRSELRLIAGRRSADKTPLAPSRLLFACDAETVARRVLDLFSDDRTRHAPRDESPHAEREEYVERPGTYLPAVPGRLVPGLALMTYEAPRPRPLKQPVTSMRVTEFRDYLACPYRYYLRHQLRLAAHGDAAEELDGGTFGSLGHNVLKMFGEGDLADCTDHEAIFAWLSDALDRAVRAEYGDAPLSAIRVQAEQLRLRLEALARWQADWAAQGWRTVRVEAGPEKPGASLVVDDMPMYLRGRIDRIDVHESRGDCFLIDYKTADRAKKPDEVHRQHGSWVDLQLPLYRHLVRAMGIDGRVRLGYVNLPKDISAVGLQVAEWSEADLESADRTAEEVIRKVRRESFWPPIQPPPDYFEEFAAICGDGPFAAIVAAASEEGEDES
jgi:RecB family exonuclease